MSAKKTESAPVEKAEKKPHTVFVNGQDVTVMASNQDDLNREIEKIKATFPA